MTDIRQPVYRFVILRRPIVSYRIDVIMLMYMLFQFPEKLLRIFFITGFMITLLSKDLLMESALKSWIKLDHWRLMATQTLLWIMNSLLALPMPLSRVPWLPAFWYCYLSVVSAINYLFLLLVLRLRQSPVPRWRIFQPKISSFISGLHGLIRMKEKTIRRWWRW